MDILNADNSASNARSQDILLREWKHEENVYGIHPSQPLQELSESLALESAYPTQVATFVTNIQNIAVQVKSHLDHAHGNHLDDICHESIKKRINAQGIRRLFSRNSVEQKTNRRARNVYNPCFTVKPTSELSTDTSTSTCSLNSEMPVGDTIYTSQVQAEVCDIPVTSRFESARPRFESDSSISLTSLDSGEIHFGVDVNPIEELSEGWVYDAFDSGEIHFVDGDLIEVIPSVSFDDEVERAVNARGCFGRGVIRHQQRIGRVRRWIRKRKEARREKMNGRQDKGRRNSGTKNRSQAKDKKRFQKNRNRPKVKKIVPDQDVGLRSEPYSPHASPLSHIHNTLAHPVQACFLRTVSYLPVAREVVRNLSSNWHGDTLCNNIKPNVYHLDVDSKINRYQQETANVPTSPPSRNTVQGREGGEKTALEFHKNRTICPNINSSLNNSSSHVNSRSELSLPLEDIDEENNEVNFGENSFNVPIVKNSLLPKEESSSDSDNEFNGEDADNENDNEEQRDEEDQTGSLLEPHLRSSAPVMDSNSVPNMNRRSPLIEIKPPPFMSATMQKSKSNEVDFVSHNNAVIRENVDQEEIYNDTLKVIFVGAPGAGKSSLVKSLIIDDESEDKENNSNFQNSDSVNFNGVDVNVQLWAPKRVASKSVSSSCSSYYKNTRGAKYSLWDLQGGNLERGSHHATQSLFFSPDSLYIVVWNIATNKESHKRPKSSLVSSAVLNPDHIEIEDQGPTRRIASVSSFEDDNYNALSKTSYQNYFRKEMALKEEKRLLERDIDENVIFWIDVISRYAPSGSVVLPVLSFDDLLNRTEVEKRRRLLKERLQHHCRTVSSPIVILDNIPTVSSVSNDGIESLRNVILDTSSLFPQMQTKLSSVACDVQEVVKQFLIKGHKVVHIDKILIKLMESPPRVNNFSEAHVRNALKTLASTGKILYFHEGNTNCSKPEILSQFVILCPKWIASAISCILQPQLRSKLSEARTLMNAQANYGGEIFPEDDEHSLFDDQSPSHFPMIKCNDTTMLWKSMWFMRKVMEEVNDNPGIPCMLSYLCEVCLHCGIFVPFSLNSNDNKSGGYPFSHFFLPGLMHDVVPNDVWNFHVKESWKTTLCHSWLLKTTPPSDLMDKIIVSALDELHQSMNHGNVSLLSKGSFAHKPKRPKMRLHQVLSWKTAFYLKVIEEEVDEITGANRLLNIIDIFVRLVHRDSPHCPSSGTMISGDRKLVISAKGRADHEGKVIWNLGYGVIIDAIDKVISSTGIRSVEKEIVCPECLTSKASARNASAWKMSFSGRNHEVMTCCSGHHVSTRLLCGISHSDAMVNAVIPRSSPHKGVSDLIGSVVLVGLWDGETNRIVEAGSGFVASRSSGLIVTASHILYDMNAGRKYYGLPKGKAVIGLIPSSSECRKCDDKTNTAVFKYFAEIVSEDLQNADACVLRITTKFEDPVEGNGMGIENQPDIPLGKRAIRAENLQSLKLEEDFLLEDFVRVIGFNQGGEGILKEGEKLNRIVDFAGGQICKRKSLIDTDVNSTRSSKELQHFPRSEIVTSCVTISGHSGGPCVNQDGAVVGILSRSSNDRSYLVPAYILKKLLKQAKAKCKMSPLQKHVFRK